MAGTDAGAGESFPGASPRRRDVLLVGLTMVSASTDALSYLGLAHVFPANMTGNTVLLGAGLATADPGAATRSATALGAFLLGAAIVGAAVPGRVSLRTFVAVVTAEAATLGAMCGWWLATGPAPGGAVRYGLIALAGITMGAQSGMVRTLDVPVTTTYITGTWTMLSAAVATWLGRRVGAARRARDAAPGLAAVVVLTYLATAYVAALVFTRFHEVATAIPVGLLVLVGGVAAAGPGRRVARG